ncbi:lipoyl(octanoyl) transferase LipB [Legionella impletisoli]|uniref:lipoyl(octanoyl) transferase LipB n=1 Tax=Legionella impletisoli TaxID=343510 RepID=UPI0013EF7353
MRIRRFSIQPYEPIWTEMKQFTAGRDEHTLDELWLLEHPPVYTQGQAGKPEHLLNPQHIPVIKSDRGGQITYHGPGQLVGYVLMDLRRRNMGIRTLVCRLEQVLIALLDNLGINAQTKCGAPGVYVDNKKIASIGLRVKNGCTYHGIALNVAMDLSPFKGINPCGYEKMEMVQIKDFISEIQFEAVKEQFAQLFLTSFEQEP